MWRVVVVLIAVGALLSFATWRSLGPKSTMPTTDGEGLIATNDGSVYFVRHPEGSFAVYLPGEWTSSSRSSSNTATMAWTTSVTLRAKGRPDVALEGDSTNPTNVTLDGVTFDLTAGSFLRLTTDGNVEQLPFAPLPLGDQDYLKRLNKYFAR